MPLDNADWEKLKGLLNEHKKEITDSFTAEMTKLRGTLTLTGKRLRRLENGFDHNAKVARTTVVDGARRDHDRLLRDMFNDSIIVAAPVWLDGDGGQRVQAPLKCTPSDVNEVILRNVANTVKFEVELAPRLGFRILVASHSSQQRRKGAASILKKAKGELESELNLRLFYDKPYELRMIQKEAHKFLGEVKKLAGDAVKEKSIEKGYFTVNGIRIAPEFLLPGSSRWEYLARIVVEKVGGWRGRPPASPECGVLYDAFAAEFAAEKGVIDLQDIETFPSDSGEPEDMQE
jgi:hypothetical protein